MLVNFVLLCFLFCQTIDGRKIEKKREDFGKNPRVLAEKNITITECDMDYYNDDEYRNDPDECHRDRMTNETIENKYGVRSCCEFHGYMATGICSGTDQDVCISTI